VAIAVRETGVSMLYTAIILFFGFILFTLSSFEGTFYVGLLTSITIIVALFANLVLLPTILRQVKIKPKNDLK
jgi:predicted RND superfamily exporter protein